MEEECFRSWEGEFVSGNHGWTCFDIYGLLHFVLVCEACEVSQAFLMQFVIVVQFVHGCSWFLCCSCFRRSLEALFKSLFRVRGFLLGASLKTRRLERPNAMNISTPSQHFSVEVGAFRLFHGVEVDNAELQADAPGPGLNSNGLCGAMAIGKCRNEM